MKNQEDILTLIFFGSTYCLLFIFGYWFVDSDNAVGSPAIKQQGVQYWRSK